MAKKEVSEIFADAMNDFVFARVNDIQLSLPKESSRYAEAFDRVLKLEAQLMEVLKDNKSLYLELEAAVGIINQEEIYAAYRAGLKDGSVVKRAVSNSLGICIDEISETMN